MEALINVIFPIFAIMALGYVAGYWKILDSDSTAALNRFVFGFALPAVLFVFTARAEISEIVNWPFMAAYLLGSAATVALALLVARFVFGLDREEVAFHGYLSVFANTGYMGIPIFLTAFGTGGILPVVVANLIGPILAIAVIMLVLEIMRSPDIPPLRRLTSIGAIFAKNPVIVSSGLGILFSLFAIPLPTPIGNLLDLLGSAAGPAALFALGLSLVGHSQFGRIMEVSWLTLLKLVVHPLLVFLFVRHVFVVDPFWVQAAIILAALPVGSTAFVVSQQYGVATQQTSASAALSTVVSVLTLSALFIVLGVK